MIQSVSPGLFAANADGAGAAAGYVVRVKADGTQINEQSAAGRRAGALCRHTNRPRAGRRDGVPGDVWDGSAGRGARDSQGADGGAEAAVSYAGPQHEYVGLDQLNLTIPRSLAGRGEVEVTIVADNQAANPLPDQSSMRRDHREDGDHLLLQLSYYFSIHPTTFFKRRKTL